MATIPLTVLVNLNEQETVDIPVESVANTNVKIWELESIYLFPVKESDIVGGRTLRVGNVYNLHVDHRQFLAFVWIHTKPIEELIDE